MINRSFSAAHHGVLIFLVALMSMVGASAAPLDPTDGGQHDLQAFQETVGPVGRIDGPEVFIVRLHEPPLARYEGNSPGLAAPGRSSSGRLDVTSAASQRYVDHLVARQGELLREIESRVGRSVNTLFAYQHAFNGLALSISAEEAQALLEDGMVAAIEPYAEYPLLTDAGPEWIGAPAVWDGSASPANVGTFGEGVVAGIIDSGINLEHPSFAATAEDGFVHQNPLGSGNYIGWCNPGVGTVTDTCNDKLIGTWDFVSAVVAGTPDVLVIPGGQDENGHGTHVAGTVAGNPVESNFGGGANPPVSGVAPRANVIAYDACYTEISTGRGLCPNVSTLAAINQVVADGIVDVINYSIGGGTDPWNQAISLAFLAAVDAGVFVSASAGNSGPGPATMGHVQPWVASVAAASHNRFFASASVTITEPEDAPTDLAVIGASNGTGPAPAGEEAVISRDPDNALGCTAFEEDFFDGQIALISRGVCGFSDKVSNAEAAGAVGVVVANSNATAPFIMGALESTTIPAVMVTEAAGASLADFIDANTSVVVALNAESPSVLVYDDSVGDIISGFSSRGPNNFNIIKPSIAAPGSQILAPVELGGGEGDPAFGLKSGTSMSSPHNAGSAVLLRALYPTWSPSEIQSALMLTAFDGMLSDNVAGGVVDATPFDQGAGRVSLDRAAGTPLVLRETPLNFFLANPATGGDPRTLNLAGISDDDCLFTCSFERTVRSVSDTAVEFVASFESDSDLSAQITPSQFTILPGQNQILTIEVDAGDPVAAWKFGSVVLTPLEAVPDEVFTDRFEAIGEGFASVPNPNAALRMPATIFASEPFPTIELGVDELSGDAVAEESVVLSLPISNTGDAVLDWDSEARDLARGDTLYSQGQTTGGGIVSGFFTTNPPDTGAYSADAFTLDEPTKLGGLFFEGFFSGGLPLAGNTSEIRIFIYEDAGGVPAGHPEDGMSNEVWSAALPVASPGLDLSNNNIDLDIGTASLAGPDLAAGTYWVTAAPVVAASGSRWNWADATSGPAVDIAKIITPGAAFNNGFPNWTDLTAVGPNFAQLSFAIDQGLECGAPWLTLDPSSGSVNEGDQIEVDVILDATGLAGGTYEAFICIASNDPDNPVVTVPVIFEVFDDNALLQVTHLAPFDQGEDTAVDIALNGNVVLNNVEYGDSTGYLSVLPGNYTIEVLLAGTSTVAISANAELAEGVRYSAIAIGDNDNQNLALTLLVDDLDAPEAGNFKLRLGHLAPFADGDASAEVRLADGTLIQAVDFGDVTGFIELAAGDYDLVITAPGGDPVLIDPIELSFSDGDIISAFAAGDGVNQDLGVFALPPGAPGFFVDLRVPAANVQIAHLAPFAADPDTLVDIVVNGTEILSGVAYGDSTGYLELDVGPTDIEILLAGTSTVAISTQVELMDRTFYTVLAVGDGDNQPLSLIAQIDDLDAPEAGNFKLRLGHLAPFADGDASAEVRLADGTLIQAVDFGDVTGFIELAAGDYDLIITAPTGEPVLINPIPLAFNGGEIVSAFATGDGANQDLGVFAWPSDAVGGFVPLLFEGVASIQEDFDGVFPPDGWERVSTGSPATCLWDLTSEVEPATGPVDPGTGGRPNFAGGDGAAATLDSDSCGSSTNVDAMLITPAVNLAGIDNPRLEFVLSFNTAFDNNQFFVDISTDLGASWSNLANWDNQDVSPTGPGTLISIDLEEYASSIAALVRFRNVAGWSNWVQIDQVSIDSVQESVEASLVGFASFYEPGDTDQGTETVAFVYTDVDQSIEQIFNVFTIEQGGVEVEAATYAELFDSLDYDDYIRGLTATNVDNVVAPETRDVTIEFTLSETAPSGAYTLVITSYDVTGVNPDDVNLTDAKAGLYPMLSVASQAIGVGAPISEDVVIDIAGQESPSLTCGATPGEERPGFAVIMAPGSTVETLDFDILLETNGPSWASEARIGLGTTSQRVLVSFLPGFDLDEPTPPGGQAFSGGFNLVDLDAAFDVGPDGALWVTFCEDFNDVSVDPDAFYREPSTIVINDSTAGDRSVQYPQVVGPETRDMLSSRRTGP